MNTTAISKLEFVYAINPQFKVKNCCRGAKPRAIASTKLTGRIQIEIVIGIEIENNLIGIEALHTDFYIDFDLDAKN